MLPINIEEKFALIHEYWTPKLIAEFDEQQVKIAKLKGEFIWHKHEHEDELFYVVKGVLQIKMREELIILKAGELYVVPKNTEHCPVAEEEVWAMFIESRNTKHTGEVKCERTVEHIERI